MIPGAAGTTINRVRVRNAGPDVLAARLGADRLLSHAAHADVIPRAAILCVKRLADPRPGTVRLASAHPPGHWIDAVNEAMASAARHAARPARDAIAGDPDAVLFDDRAEMLACLAADWGNGVVARRWWWRALVGDVHTIEAVLRTWLERPAYIAAAFERVALLGAAPAFLLSLSRGDAQRLTAAVVSAHGLSQIAHALATPSSDAPSDNGDVKRPTHTAHDVEPADPQAAVAREMRPPWAFVAPEAMGPVLPREQQLFAGVTLTLRRQPAVARSEAFATSVRAWQSTSLAHTASNLMTSGSRPSRSQDRPHADHAMGPPADAGHEAARPLAWEVIPVDPLPPDARASIDATNNQAPRDHLTTGVSIPALEPFVVRTAFGGLFFLLNVATVMGYYGDFTEPRRRNLDLSIWDFVALVGRALVPAVEEDGAWSLLATLAGRHDDERPGAGVAPPDHATSWEEWLVPPVRERLRAAFGATGDASLDQLIVCRHASVRVTSTHVDVHFALADLPIDIRMSGLDRDPGWIPAADRVVTFYFE